MVNREAAGPTGDGDEVQYDIVGLPVIPTLKGGPARSAFNISRFLADEAAATEASREGFESNVSEVSEPDEDAPPPKLVAQQQTQAKRAKREAVEGGMAEPETRKQEAARQNAAPLPEGSERDAPMQRQTSVGIDHASGSQDSQNEDHGGKVVAGVLPQTQQPAAVIAGRSPRRSCEPSAAVVADKHPPKETPEVEPQEPPTKQARASRAKGARIEPAPGNAEAAGLPQRNVQQGRAPKRRCRAAGADSSLGQSREGDTPKVGRREGAALPKETARPAQHAVRVGVDKGKMQVDWEQYARDMARLAEEAERLLAEEDSDV
jgi:hypothetical protein